MAQPLQVINLDVLGMTCVGCVSSVEKTLRNLDGVDSAEVNFALNRVSVHYNPESTNSSQLVTALETTGFSARLLKENDDYSEPSKHSEEEYLKLRSRMKFATVFSAPLVLLAMAPMLGFSLPGLISPETEPFNYGLIQLKNGNFKEGWKNYEWRKKKSINKNKHIGEQDREWSGEENLKDKTIFIYNEQGLGDYIQFSRYLILIYKQNHFFYLLVYQYLFSNHFLN